MALQQTGFRLLNDITWVKPNPPPNLGRRTFTHSTETLLWASKAHKGSRHKYTFNYDQMRDENGGKQMQTVWRIPTPRRSELGFGKHPTQKPVALIAQCLRASTRAGEIVLDPFAGSGSAGVAALQEGRRFIGIEIEQEFVDLSVRRLTPPPPPRFWEGADKSVDAAEPTMDRETALEKLQRLVGQDLRQVAEEYDVTVWRNGKLNKGWAGHAVERYLGLPLNSARSPNFGSWELKVVPLTAAADGSCNVKETMAITMLDPDEVRQKSFAESHLLLKLRKIIAVARLREDPAESRSVCHLVHAFDLEETALYNLVAQDYQQIQQVIREQGANALNGSIGQYVQPRTKGAGHGSTSLAFYARKELVAYIVGLKPSPRVVQSFIDCPDHAGQPNSSNREHLDAAMASLRANQSGVGRHKCPYCAYELGYQQALTDILASVNTLR